MADLPSTPPLSYGTKRRKSYSTRGVEFGEDYSVRVGNGKNSRRQYWTLVWNNIKATDRATLEAFFDVTKGTTFFTWIPPNEVTAIKLVVEDVDDEPSGHQVWNYTVQCRQVFDP